MDLRLRDRVVVVTGGSANIGAATAVAFGREGARVALTYRSRPDAAEKVARQVEEAGGQAHTVPFDLADRWSAGAVVRSVLGRWGGLDVLVNNAVSWRPPAPGAAPVALENADDWASVVEANLGGHIRMLRSAVPAIRRSPAGRIVNVSTVTVDRGAPGLAAEAAAKSGLHGLTRSLAWELGPAGVLVNVVMPGVVVDGKDGPPPLPEAVLEEARAALPTGRFPLAAHVADAVVFLCSSANGSITGEVVRVTGGRG